MADPEKAGTPEATPPVSESAGTGAQAPDGSESAGKPVDPALAMAWKAKAERVNEAEARLREAEAKLAAAQQAQYAQAQAADPMAQMVQSLRERAQYGDNDAATQLALMTMTATQQAENMLTAEMVKASVPADKWDTVAALVRQSNYRTSVQQALVLARGSEVPVLSNELEAKNKRIAELEKALNARTVGGGGPGNPASTPPAAASVGDAPEMTPEDYYAALARGGPEAIALRDKGVRFKR